MISRIILTVILIIYSFHLGYGDEPSVKILKINNGIESVNSLDELTDDLLNKKIIYIGEVHNNPEHHKIQLEIIKKLYDRNDRIAIGMEMFQKDFQNIVNSYITGRISEEVFIKKTEYEKRWGFEYEMYKPIIDFARDKKIPLAALSINSEIIRKMSENGLNNLGSRELGSLPDSVDFTNEDHKNYIEEVFNTHPKTGNSDFKKFYNIQIIWDESMAENIDKFLKKYPGYSIVVLAGNGHIVYSYGIPDRAYRRNKIEYTTILNDTEHLNGISDYVIYSGDREFH